MCKGSCITSFLSSTVSKKITMALTGAILVGFALSHMVGNLKIFLGKNPATLVYKFDEYAQYLREIGAHLFGHGGFLWVARGVLLLCVILHAVSGIQLAILNRKAKPVPPHKPKYANCNPASRTMFYGGLFLVVFIVYHILHFTTGTLHLRGFVEGNVYNNVVLGFQSRPIAIAYIVSMGFLALHLYHGTWSMFQTLGIDSPLWNRGIRTAAKLVSVIIFLGFSSVPLSVLFGILRLP